VNQNLKGFIADITDDDVQYNRGVGLQTLSSDLSSSIKAGNYIVFQGDGELHVTVVSTLPGTIKHTTPAGGTVTDTYTNADYQTITIDPTSYKYVDDGKGRYQITLTLTNMEIANAKMVDDLPVCEYSTIAKPDNSRVVDFSKGDDGKPESSGNVAFGYNSNGALNANKIYESVELLKYWTTTSANDNNLYRTDKVAGDYFIQLLDYNGNAPAVQWFLVTNGLYAPYGDQYSFSGLHRVFFPYGEQKYDSSNEARVKLTSTGANQKMAFVLGGFTLPLNHALYNKGYQDVSVISDTSVALVTIAACEKLKSEMGSNTNIYVIAYRTTASDQIKSCASDSSSPYFQSATTEAKLNEALSKIAADIKIFANHRESYVQ
jgi:hypothetical protein